LNNHPRGSNFLFSCVELAHFLLFFKFKFPTAFEIAKSSIEEPNAPGILISPPKATNFVITSAAFPKLRHLSKQQV
jgi:hypothetical protein